MSSLIHAYNEGGFFMHPILLTGIAVFAIMVERAMALYKGHKKAPADLRQKVLTLIASGSYADARAYVEMAAPGTSIGTVINAGLQVRQAGGGDEEVQARMDEALSGEISHIDQRTGFLAVFGNVATLLGLLGTVTGMIVSFAGVANANPAERATLLGAGIAEALNATAFGLAVAIPSLVGFAIFQNRTDRIVGALTEEASKIFHDLLFRGDSVASDRKAAGMRTETTTEGFAQRGN
jgi:biopolymer transport protein ExbB